MSVSRVGGAWQEKRLRDAVTKLVDGSHNPPAKQDSGHPMLSARNVEQGNIVFDDFRFISDEAFITENARTRVAPGDVLLTIVGSIGRSAVVPPGIGPFALQRSVAVLSPVSDLDSRFLSYQLQSPRIQRYFEAHARGTAQKGVYLKTLGETPLVLPGLDEQRNIVAEIEKQFSRLDEAVANLQRVKANLKRYTAAVLTAATEGTLGTFGDAALEPFENRVDGAFAGEQELTPLPASWRWSTAGAAVDAFEAGASFKCVERPPKDGEVGVLKVSALTWGTYDEQESKTCMDPSRVDLRYVVKPGDFLFSRANTIELVGACVIVGTVTKQLMLSDKTLRLRINPAVAPAWLQCCLRSKFGRAEIERLATGNQESMRNIGQERIRQIRMPLPPLAEQHCIVDEVGRRLSIVREVEAEVDANLKRARALRQAVLRVAFSYAAAGKAA